MVMESTRRSFDRSISKEPGLKKPRLAEGHGAPPPPHRPLADRSGAIQRSVFSSTGGGSRAQRDEDSESIDPLRVPYQPQPGNQLHQELVDQYKLALSELTFNSKPIITNLTIIAGENLHSAKAIAATVCSNILEVPREQKLPSLYLLDSIVKNIGRDYIKYFASRLPEVFCKTYRQADPSIHQGMRHLFGTWKGVFPAHILQMIEKELVFTTTTNGLSSGKTVSRSDSQAQRPAHSIHVNPKYLEARQRLQTPRARGSGNDTGSISSTYEDVEASGRTTSISSERLPSDPYAKSINPQYKDKVNVAVHDQISSMPYLESEYGSSLGARKVNDSFLEQGLDLSWSESGINAPGKVINMKNGLHMQLGHQSVKSNSRPQLKQNYANRNPNGDIPSWKNSEEEEYTWDATIARPTTHYAHTLAKNVQGTDSTEKLDFDIDIHRPQRLHNIGLRVPDESSVNSMSGIHVPFSLPEEQNQSEGGMFLDPGQNISSYTQGYSTELRNLSAGGLSGRPSQSQSQQSCPPLRGQNLKLSADVAQELKVSVTQQTLGAASAQSGRNQRTSSSSFSTLNQKKLQNNSTDRKQTSTGPPKDPRKPPRQKNTASSDQVLQDSQPLSSRDVHKVSTKKVPAQSSQTSSGTTVIHSLHQRKNLPSQKRKLEESPDDDKVSGAPISGLGNRSTEGNSSVQSSSLINDSSAPVAVKSRKLGSPSLKVGLSKLGGPEVGLRSSSQGTPSSLPSSSSPALVLSHHPSDGNIQLSGLAAMKSESIPLPEDSLPSSLVGTRSEQESGVANSTSDPFSSLLNSLVAKGLISSSKSDSPSSASTQKYNQQSPDRCPEVSNIGSTSESSGPLTTGKPVLSITDEPSALKPAAIASVGLGQSTQVKKSFIGFEFRSDVIRTLHSDVLDDLLLDLPYKCDTCGLKLKLQESFDRHMEWHSLITQENSRRWYTNVDGWTNGVGCNLSEETPPDSLVESDSILESNEPMVPADESQCACILCGELFDDFYCRQRNEWMFKGTVYLSDPSSEFPEMTVATSDVDFAHPIVHANCLNQDIKQDLDLT